MMEPHMIDFTGLAIPVEIVVNHVGLITIFSPFLKVLNESLRKIKGEVVMIKISVTE